MADKFVVTPYFFNPNIQPADEYTKRRENLKTAIKGKSKSVIEEKYAPDEHSKEISADVSFPKRCLSCYRLRLERTARYARENGFDFFSTTLLVSPYQQHKELKKIGVAAAAKYDIEFYYQDFRPNFRKGQNKARELGIYRQKYCGCLLSKTEAGH